MDRDDRRAPSTELDAGRVGRVHGLDGSFYVAGARPGALVVGGAVTVDGHTRAIERLAGTPQRPIVRLEGIADRAGAKALQGLTLIVQRTQAPELGEDEWWAEELEGCAVLAGERLLGTVIRLVELPSCEALEVRAESGGQPLLVPMVKDAIRRVVISERRIEVDGDFLGLEAPQAGADASRADRGRAGGQRP